MSDGLYGLTLPDLTADQGLLVPAPPDWRPWRVIRRWGEGERVDGTVGADQARLRLAPHGSLVVDRQSRTSTLTMPRPPSDAELAHPYMSATAALAARWEGWQSFHAGGFAVGGRVWGVLGEREVGKSSLLAGLARVGVEVVSDDVLVVREGRALAGPRCIDLRERSARELAIGESIGVVGTRERWRVCLGPIAPELPLGGWLTLAWDENESLERVEPGERFLRLLENLTVALEPPDPPTVLSLAALPMMTLRRPRRLDTLGQTVERLVAELDGR